MATPTHDNFWRRIGSKDIGISKDIENAVGKALSGR